MGCWVLNETLDVSIVRVDVGCSQGKVLITLIPLLAIALPHQWWRNWCCFVSFRPLSIWERYRCETCAKPAFQPDTDSCWIRGKICCDSERDGFLNRISFFPLLLFANWELQRNRYFDCNVSCLPVVMLLPAWLFVALGVALLYNMIEGLYSPGAFCGSESFSTWGESHYTHQRKLHYPITSSTSACVSVWVFTHTYTHKCDTNNCFLV